MCARCRSESNDLINALPAGSATLIRINADDVSPPNAVSADRAPFVIALQTTATKALATIDKFLP